MNIAAELATHAREELEHTLIIAKQVDYLGGMPKVTPKPVKTSDKAEEMLRFDLDNEVSVPPTPSSIAAARSAQCRRHENFQV